MSNHHLHPRRHCHHRLLFRSHRLQSMADGHEAVAPGGAVPDDDILEAPRPRVRRRTVAIRKQGEPFVLAVIVDWQKRPEQDLWALEQIRGGFPAGGLAEVPAGAARWCILSLVLAHWVLVWAGDRRARFDLETERSGVEGDLFAGYVEYTSSRMFTLESAIPLLEDPCESQGLGLRRVTDAIRENLEAEAFLHGVGRHLTDICIASAWKADVMRRRGEGNVFHIVRIPGRGGARLLLSAPSRATRTYFLRTLPSVRQTSQPRKRKRGVTVVAMKNHSIANGMWTRCIFSAWQISRNI